MTYRISLVFLDGSGKAALALFSRPDTTKSHWARKRSSRPSWNVVVNPIVRVGPRECTQTVALGAVRRQRAWVLTFALP